MKKSIPAITASLAIAASLVSCTKDRAGEYDTAATPGPAASAPSANPASTVYDTPAAYQESSGTPTAPVPTSPEAIATSAPEPSPTATHVAPPTPPPANGAAVIHTVVSGDTLSGISAKYRVPKASIKTANRMTNDVVVLGRKMVIPPQ